MRTLTWANTDMVPLGPLGFPESVPVLEALPPSESGLSPTLKGVLVCSWTPSIGIDPSNKRSCL